MRNLSNDSKFIQQHLANERTYLAWVRTCIAIIGLGFLAAGLLYRSNMAHWISTAVGIGAVVLGGCVLALATFDYFSKRKAINEEKFQSPTLIIWLVFITLEIISVLLTALVIIMLF
jgi:putative membrane protein